MTAQAAPPLRWRMPFTRDQRAAILLTVVMTLAALGLGYALRMAVESGTTPVSQGGIAADVTAGWLVRPGFGDQGFSAFDPQSPATSLYATRLAGTDAEAAGRAHIAEDVALRDGYTEVDASAVRLGEREGYRIDFAFVESGSGGELPQLVRGIGLYLVEGDGVIGLVFQAPAEDFTDEVDRFFRFAGSARVATQ